LYQSGFQYDYLEAKDKSGAIDHGKLLSYRAKNSGTFYAGLTQGIVNSRLEMQAVGERFANPSNTKQLAGYTLFNMATSVKVTPEFAIGLRINNIFDENYETIQNYGTLGTNGLLTLTYTPKL
jgi:vitamin B12 transporter